MRRSFKIALPLALLLVVFGVLAVVALLALLAVGAAFKKNDWLKAEQRFVQALALDPDLDLSRTRLAEARQQLVKMYHERALVAYRKQRLDEAIGWWDKALAIDPNYEPALGYRARALELKRRLEQLNATE